MQTKKLLVKNYIWNYIFYLGISANLKGTLDCSKYVLLKLESAILKAKNKMGDNKKKQPKESASHHWALS